MLRSFLLILIISAACLTANGQADSIMALPADIQRESLWNWYRSFPLGDTARLRTVLNGMRKDFNKAGADDLAAESWWLWNYFITSHYYPYNDTFAILLDHAADYAIEQNWQVQLAEIYIHKGLLYLGIRRHVAGFESLMAGEEIIRKTGIEKFPGVHSSFLFIGDAYLSIGDYEKAIPYLREAMAHPPKIYDPGFSMGLMNTIGICYMRLMKYDSAIISYQEAHKAAKKINDEFWIALTGGNLGYVYYLQGDLDMALPLLTEDYGVSLKNNQTGSAVNASLSLASIHLKKGNREEAEKYIDFFTRHIDRKDDHAMKIFYENLYLLEKLKGNYQLATTYTDSAKVYGERFESGRDKTILEKARLQLEMAHHLNELQHLEHLRKRQVMIRNMLLAFTLLSGIIAFLIINRNAFRRKKELELAQTELAHYMNTIREKNELIDSFSQEIEQMRASEEHKASEQTEHLAQLMQASILTEEDWKHFRSLFDVVHPGFFSRLKSRMPDLTPAETRLLALTKLKLATREMASMLGISYESMKKTRQRLRKKINLPEEGSLDELVAMI